MIDNITWQNEHSQKQIGLIGTSNFFDFVCALNIVGISSDGTRVKYKTMCWFVLPLVQVLVSKFILLHCNLIFP